MNFHNYFQKRIDIFLFPIQNRKQSKEITALYHQYYWEGGGSLLTT